MAEVLYFAMPFFVLLLIAEYMAYRHLDGDHDGPGYEARDTRTSLAMGLGNVLINAVWKFAVLAVFAVGYEIAPVHLPTDASWTWILLFLADDLS